MNLVIAVILEGYEDRAKETTTLKTNSTRSISSCAVLCCSALLNSIVAQVDYLSFNALPTPSYPARRGKVAESWT